MNAPVDAPKAHLQFVLNPSKVKDSLAVLRQLRAHSTLVGYLCVQRTAAQERRLDNLHPLFREFFRDFLVLDNAPENRPFINPFVASDAKVWTNKNPAGSYAPSSLRGVSPLLKVLSISEDGLYTLKPQYWIEARRLLIEDKKIPVLPLVTFLFRDRGFTSDAPTIGGLIRAFQHEFGYLDERGNTTEAYNYLYADYTAEESQTQIDWFIPYSETIPSEQ